MLTNFLIEILKALLTNRIDAMLAAPILDNIFKNLKQKDKHSNQELEKSLNICFLSALQTIVRDCHKELIGSSILQRYRGVIIYPPEHQKELQWLDAKLCQLAKDIKQIKQIENFNLPLQSIDDVPSLLTTKGTLLVREKLIAEALKDNFIPECYAVKVRANLFEETCNNFTAEIKHNPGLKDIVELKLLANINSSLGDKKLKIQDLDNALVHPSEARRKVKLEFDIEKLDAVRLEAIVQQIQKLLDDGSIRLSRIEAGCMELYFDGSKKSLEKLDALLKSGELQEILDIPVQNEIVINLSQWLQNIIDESWQTLEDVLGTETNKLVVARSAIGIEGVIRAQRIDLEAKPATISLALTVAIQPKADEHRKISLELYPIGSSTLPLGLQCSVLDTSGQTLKQVQTHKPEHWIHLDISGETKEHFRLQIEFCDSITIKNFVI